MSDGVQTSDELNENHPLGGQSVDDKDLSSGPIKPGKGALEIEAAKQKRFNSGDESVQGAEGVNFTA